MRGNHSTFTCQTICSISDSARRANLIYRIRQTPPPQRWADITVLSHECMGVTVSITLASYSTQVFRDPSLSKNSCATFSIPYLINSRYAEPCRFRANCSFSAFRCIWAIISPNASNGSCTRTFTSFIRTCSLLYLGVCLHKTHFIVR